jgi:hypothetical protein
MYGSEVRRPTLPSIDEQHFSCAYLSGLGACEMEALFCLRNANTLCSNVGLKTIGDKE